MAQAEPKSSAERITQADRILSLMQRIRDSRCVLLVHFDNDKNIFTSAVLDVDPAKKLVSFDELNPQAGHEKLLAVKSMHVTARLDGISARFRVSLKQAQLDKSPAVYLAPLPDKVIYEQRRASFRVRVPLSMEIPVALTINGTEKFEGILMDISNNGIGAYIDKAAPLGEGDKDEREYFCRIDLPDGAFISGEMEMRFLKMDDKLDKWQIGGQFVNLSGPQNQAVNRFVMGLQRAIIKQTRGG